MNEPIRVVTGRGGEHDAGREPCVEQLAVSDPRGQHPTQSIHDGGIHDDGASGVSRFRNQREGGGGDVRRQKRGEGGGCVFHDGWVFDNSREGVWMFGVGRDRCKADADNV